MNLPKMPKQLQPMTMDEIVRQFAMQGESPKAGKLEGQTWCGQGGDFLEWHGCHFLGCRFVGSKMQRNYFSDVIFENCDLSNVDWREANFFRVLFQNCKMVGANFAELSAHHVECRQGNLQYANLNDGIFQEVSWIDSSLKQVGFCNCHLKKTTFTNCSLAESELLATSLQDIDLRSCDIQGIQLSGPELRGAIVDVFQAADLARFLGLVVK